MSHYHELGGPSRNTKFFPQIVHLPVPSTPPMSVDKIQIEPYILRRKPKSKPQSSDMSTFESHLKHLTPKQKKAFATALFLTSIGLGLAADSNIAHAAATDCGRDWFDTCLCNGQVVDGDVYCPKDGQQSQKNTLPDPNSEQNRKGWDRSIDGSTLAACAGVVVIFIGVCALAISRDLNNDMPN